jgi:calcineurin-like phosphoesterase family protein
MNQAILDNHNSVVRPTDNFYFLGDLAHGRDATPERVEDFLRQLNGNKFFIKGNHDKKETIALYKKYGTYLGHMAEIYVGDQMITLNHYAMRVWNKSHHGSWHLYGHSHGSLPDDPNSLSLDCGVDAAANYLSKDGALHPQDYRPLSFDEIAELMKKKSWKPIDHHGVDRNRIDQLAGEM